MKWFRDGTTLADIRPKLVSAGTALILAAVLFAIRRVPVGISFLFTFAAGVSLLCCLWRLSLLPFASPLLCDLAKLFRRAVVVALIIFAISFVCVEGLILSCRSGNSQPDADYILVLGAGVNGEEPSWVLQERIDTAAAYLTENPGTRAVLCGGQGEGEDITEAEAIRRGLLAAGIAESRLILEDQSHNTEENISNALALIEAETGKEAEYALGIVTTDFHLYRARRLCAVQGRDTFGIAAELPPVLLFKPNYYLREYFAVSRILIAECLP